MTIDNIVPDPLRQAGIRGTGAGGDKDAGPKPVRSKGPVPRADRVEISDEARTLAARDEAASDRLSAEQVDAIRKRIADGEFDEPAVMEKVAARILEREDL